MGELFDFSGEMGIRFQHFRLVEGEDGVIAKFLLKCPFRNGLHFSFLFKSHLQIKLIHNKVGKSESKIKNDQFGI